MPSKISGENPACCLLGMQAPLGQLSCLILHHHAFWVLTSPSPHLQHILTHPHPILIPPSPLPTLISPLPHPQHILTHPHLTLPPPSFTSLSSILSSALWFQCVAFVNTYAKDIIPLIVPKRDPEKICTVSWCWRGRAHLPAVHHSWSFFTSWGCGLWIKCHMQC